MNCVTETLTKMIESLPEPLQKKLLDEITPLISEALDDAKWETQFQSENEGLIKLAGQVKEQISTGQAIPMDFSKLRFPPIPSLPFGNHIMSWKMRRKRRQEKHLDFGGKIRSIRLYVSNVLSLKHMFGLCELR